MCEKVEVVRELLSHEIPDLDVLIVNLTNKCAVGVVVEASNSRAEDITLAASLAITS